MLAFRNAKSHQHPLPRKYNPESIKGPTGVLKSPTGIPGQSVMEYLMDAITIVYVGLFGP